MSENYTLVRKSPSPRPWADEKLALMNLSVPASFVARLFPVGSEPSTPLQLGTDGKA